MSETKLSRPIIITTVIVGVLAYLGGLAVCHWPYSAFGFEMNAIQITDRCRQFASMGRYPRWQVEALPVCAHAHELRTAGDSLIVLGLGLAVTGAVLAVRRFRRARTAAERQAAVQRHPSSRSRAEVAR